jgi:diguanylate cyclase (GGDEF)-like protein
MRQFRTSNPNGRVQVKKGYVEASRMRPSVRDLKTATVFAANEPRLERSSPLTRGILDAAGTVTLLVNRSGIIEFESGALSRHTGWPPQSTVGLPCFEVLRVHAAQRVMAAFGLITCGRLKHATFEFEVRTVSGDVLVFLAMLSDALSAADVGAVVVTAHEISRRKAFEVALRHNANHDSLTGLYNRRAVLRQINQWISGVGATGARPAVLLVDIDGFKAVNDAYGHAVGDAMLVSLAERLSQLDPANVGAARLGGDELLLFARYQDVENQLPRAAMTVLAAMRKPVRAESHWIHTSASIGIAAYPEGGTSAEELVRNADLALYQAKDAGRDTVRWFSSDAARRLRERTVLRDELEQALVDNEFAIHFQPIIDVTARTVHSYEALLRWQHPRRGLLSACDFIPEIDGSGLTVPLAQWTLRSAFKSAQSRATVHRYPVNVNIHPRLFQRTNFASQFMRTLRDDGISPGQLAIEITEHDFVRTADASPGNIIALVDAGIRIIIDDFGTGFSNFGYLARFPVHAIKIDREFVAQIGINTRSESLISALIGLADKLSIQTIGEGIETEEQSDYLSHQGCTLQQGYYWGRPSPDGAPARVVLPAAPFRSWL